MRFIMTTVMLALLVSLAWLVGCTDVSSTGPEAPVINSEFRFLNAADDLGNVSISFVLSDAPDVGGLGVGDSNTHQTYPSGNRIGVLSTGDTLRIPMTGEQRATVVLLPDTEGFRDFVKLIERRIFDPPAVPVADSLVFPINDSTGSHVADTTFFNVAVGRLRVVHGVPGQALDISIQGQSTALPDGNTIERGVALTGVEYRTVGSYSFLPVGDYTINVADATGAVLATTQVTLGAIRRTSVVLNTASGVSFVNLEDN